MRLKKGNRTFWIFRFLVTCTQLYKSLCQSVGWSVPLVLFSTFSLFKPLTWKIEPKKIDILLSGVCHCVIFSVRVSIGFRARVRNGFRVRFRIGFRVRVSLVCFIGWNNSTEKNKRWSIYWGSILHLQNSQTENLYLNFNNLTFWLREFGLFLDISARTLTFWLMLWRFSLRLDGWLTLSQISSYFTILAGALMFWLALWNFWLSFDIQIGHWHFGLCLDILTKQKTRPTSTSRVLSQKC